MTYSEFKAKYLTKATAEDKINFKGLAAGDNININAPNKSPKLIGKVESAKTLDVLKYFEGEIAGAKVENAIIVTAAGDIYHCSGDVFVESELKMLRGIDERFIYELNRNVEDIETLNLTIEDMQDGYQGQHFKVTEEAKRQKIGYRRWRRE